MKNIIAALAALVITTTAVFPAQATDYIKHRKPVVAHCIQPMKYEPATGVSEYPAYLVSMVTIDGQRWAAYIDHQWSQFEWTPGSFLYPSLYDGDLPNQQELVGVLDRCEEKSGVPCRMLGIDQISPNPRR